jgi:hypothetical protein
LKKHKFFFEKFISAQFFNELAQINHQN